MKQSKKLQNLETLVSVIKTQEELSLDLRDANIMECAEHYFLHSRAGNEDFIRRILNNLGEIKFIKISDISHKFLCQLAVVLSESGYANTTVKYVVGYIRRIAKWSSLYGAQLSPTISRTIKMAINPYKLALGYNELITIATYPIHLMQIRKDTMEAYERARDTFVLACNLGQRWSDIHQINPDNFDGDTYRCYQRKTGNYAVVNIEKMSLDPSITRRILKQYEMTCPWKLSYRNLATTLKHFFTAIGLNEVVQYFEPTMEDSRCRSIKKPKWDLVTMHSARRTFITLNSARGISPQSLMKASGHASISSFSRYVCS